MTRRAGKRHSELPVGWEEEEEEDGVEREEEVVEEVYLLISIAKLMKDITGRCGRRLPFEVETVCNTSHNWNTSQSW